MLLVAVCIISEKKSARYWDLNTFPSLPQVGVPEEVAKILTYPERVTEHNLPLMRQLVLNGPDMHPGALYLEQKSTPGIKKSIRHLWKKKHEIAQNLREGDTVERWVTGTYTSMGERLHVGGCSC